MTGSRSWRFMLGLHAPSNSHDKVRIRGRFLLLKVGQSQTAVTVFFSSKQLLLFAIAQRSGTRFCRVNKGKHAFFYFYETSLLSVDVPL